MATATVTGFRRPWEDGAKAYHEADTLEAMWNGVKRFRKPLTVLVKHAGLKGVPCACCGRALDGEYTINADTKTMARTLRDESGHSYVDVNPRAKTAVARHYYCMWTGTLAAIDKLRPFVG